MQMDERSVHRQSFTQCTISFLRTWTMFDVQSTGFKRDHNTVRYGLAFEDAVNNIDGVSRREQ